MLVKTDTIGSVCVTQIDQLPAAWNATHVMPADLQSLGLLPPIFKLLTPEKHDADHVAMSAMVPAQSLAWTHLRLLFM